MINLVVIVLLAITVVALSLKLKKINHDLKIKKIESDNNTYKSSINTNIKRNDGKQQLTLGQIVKASKEISPQEIKQKERAEEQEKGRQKELNRYLQIRNMPENEYLQKVKAINDKIEKYVDVPVTQSKVSGIYNRDAGHFSLATTEEKMQENVKAVPFIPMREITGVVNDGVEEVVFECTEREKKKRVASFERF